MDKITVSINIKKLKKLQKKAGTNVLIPFKKYAKIVVDGEEAEMLNLSVQQQRLEFESEPTYELVVNFEPKKELQRNN